MSEYSGIGSVWKLVTFRNGEQGNARSLEEAEFRFGRTGQEVLDSGIRCLPTGLVSLIIHSGHEGDALESGFSLEISRRPISNSGWVSFSKILGCDSVGPNWERPRSLFSSPELEGTVELVNIGSPCTGYNRVPSKLSLRVRPLTMPLIAWALSNNILSCSGGEQRTLDDWIELPSMKRENRPEKLALPGPSDWNYKFLN